MADQDANLNVNLNKSGDSITPALQNVLELAQQVEEITNNLSIGGGNNVQGGGNAANVISSSSSKSGMSSVIRSKGRFTAPYSVQNEEGQLELFSQSNLNQGIVLQGTQSSVLAINNARTESAGTLFDYSSSNYSKGIKQFGMARTGMLNNSMGDLEEADAYTYDKADLRQIAISQRYNDREDARIADKQDKIARYTKQVAINDMVDEASVNYSKSNMSRYVSSVHNDIMNSDDKPILDYAKRIASIKDKDIDNIGRSAVAAAVEEEGPIDNSTYNRAVFNRNLSDNWKQFSNSYSGRFARGGLYALGSSAAEYAHSMENEQMTGRPDYLSRGNAGGSAIGGIIGAGIGSLFPGYGTFIGAGVGMQLGGTIGQWSQVSNQQSMMSSLALQPISALMANYANNFGTPGGQLPLGPGQDYRFNIPNNPIMQGANRLTYRSMQQRTSIGEGYWATGSGASWGAGGFKVRPNGYDTAVSTVEGMAAGYESTYQGILDAGENPDAFTDFASEGSTPVKIGSHKRGKVDANGNPVGHWEEAPFRDRSFNSGTNITDTYGRSTDVVRSTNRQGRSFIDNLQEGRGGLNIAPRNGVPFNPYGSPSVYGEGSSSGTNFNSTGVTKTYTSGITEGNRSKFIQDQEDVDDFAPVPTGNREIKYQWYRENAEKLYGASSDELLKKVFSPIYGAKNKTGDNIADIIMQFGGTSTGLYEQMLTPYGNKPPIGIEQATKFGAGMQGAERAATLAQLSVRDSGLHSLQAADQAMSLMVDKDGNELIPGAKSSVVYAQTVQKQISSQNKLWQENDQMGFNMSSMRLANEEKRYEVSPYSPGNRMAMSLEGLRLDKNQIKLIQNRESYLKMHNMLSEDQEFQMESQIEGLKTNRAEQIGHLVEGVANRLPAMSAGRPSFADRIDSRQMTAMQFGMIGFPYRGSGAMGSNQMKMQENFLSTYLDPDEISSRSRTSTLNNMGGRSGMNGTSSTGQSGTIGTTAAKLAGETVTTSSPSTDSILKMIYDRLGPNNFTGKNGKLYGEPQGATNDWYRQHAGSLQRFGQ